jgi:hypothetical protein
MDLWIFITGLFLLSRLCGAELLGSNLESRTLGLADIPPCGVRQSIQYVRIKTNIREAPMHDPLCTGERMRS